MKKAKNPAITNPAEPIEVYLETIQPMNKINAQKITISKMDLCLLESISLYIFFRTIPQKDTVARPSEARAVRARLRSSQFHCDTVPAQPPQRFFRQVLKLVLN